jgi:mannose-6-phosphate isomerase-like protein (cupin superfamily)
MLGSANRPFPDDAPTAPPRWFLSTLTWIRASGEDTDGRLSLVEQLIPAGFASPWHVHHTEDESFYVIEGSMTVVVGDKHISLGSGDYAFGPREVPHGFRIEGDKPARILLMTTGGDFANFVREMSEPAVRPVLPEARQPDVPKLIAAAARHGCEILGPLPA